MFKNEKRDGMSNTLIIERGDLKGKLLSHPLFGFIIYSSSHQTLHVQIQSLDT
jgi:hypothetical protein